MKTIDIFRKTNSKKINETVEKVFGTKLNIESYESVDLEDLRNKLRTQIFNFKQGANFNETVENETYTKAQWMLDAVNAELLTREEQAQEQKRWCVQIHRAQQALGINFLAKRFRWHFHGRLSVRAFGPHSQRPAFYI